MSVNTDIRIDAHRQIYPHGHPQCVSHLPELQSTVINPFFPGNSGLYDPTEVHVRSNLRASIKESLGIVHYYSALPLTSQIHQYKMLPTCFNLPAYMGYHMFSFFIYMWLLVSSLTQNQINPIAPQEMPW